MAEESFSIPPELSEALLNDLQESLRPENCVIDDPAKRQAVLKALGAPLSFASAAEPVAADGIMNYWLWCYFEQGSAWQNLLTVFNQKDITLEAILEGYEFNAFIFQGKRYLSLMPVERYVTNGVLVLNTPEWSRRIEIRIPEEFQNILAYRTLEIFAEEITHFETDLGEWFEEVKEEIGNWLVSKYEGINPTRKGFIQWFFAHHGYIEMVQVCQTV